MFTQLKAKSNGLRVRVALGKVSSIQELESGTELTFDNGSTLVVDESYQTVSNRAAKATAGHEVSGAELETPAPAL